MTTKRASFRDYAPQDTVDRKIAAQLIGVSWKTLEGLGEDGPPFAKVGRRVLYRVEQLDAWIADRMRR